MPVAASRGFADGGGAVLFPEQLSVVNRPPRQAFGVVFLPKLAALFTAHVLPVLDAARLGFDPDDRATLHDIRATAFAAHEWGLTYRSARGKGACAVPALLIAATGEMYGAVIVHYDRDFDTIAAITGQPVECIVPPGSVP